MGELKPGQVGKPWLDSGGGVIVSHNFEDHCCGISYF